MIVSTLLIMTFSLAFNRRWTRLLLYYWPSFRARAMPDRRQWHKDSLQPILLE
jgi:hypothetical protein